jgi:cupin fold WbuC family metalloprotein
MKKKLKKNNFITFNNNFKIINLKNLEDLKNVSKNNSFNSRFCLHEKIHDKQQEMIICQKQNLSYPPKKIIKSDQSFLILKGKLLIIIFDNYGRIKNKVILSKDKNMYLRVKKNTFHCDIPLTPYSIHLEIKNCIFNKNTNKVAKFKFDPMKVISQLKY